MPWALWHTLLMRVTVVLGAQGRIVLPAQVRNELGLQPGDELVLSTGEGRIVLEPREAAARRLRGRYRNPATAGALEELLSERRRAAAGE